MRPPRYLKWPYMCFKIPNLALLSFTFGKMRIGNAIYCTVLFNLTEYRNKYMIDIVFTARPLVHTAAH